MMDPRSQRLLLAIFAIILTIALYRDFSDKGTVRRFTQHAVSFAGKKLEIEDETDVAGLKPANATVGVSVLSPYKLASQRH